SMTSLTRIAYGSRVRRHGRSRPFRSNHARRRRSTAPAYADDRLAAVLVVPAHPGRTGPVLAAAFPDEVEVGVRRLRDVDGARVRGVRVEDATVVVLVVDAQPFALGVPRRNRSVVVDGFLSFVRRERHPVVDVERAPERRVPGEAPAHPLL